MSGSTRSGGKLPCASVPGAVYTPTPRSLSLSQLSKGPVAARRLETGHAASAIAPSSHARPSTLT
eukprot:8529772-Alexandrium_andersonii.AAC.1